MAYDPSAPYQPPRRPYPQQLQQNDGQYYDERPPPMGERRPPPNFNNYRDQPQSLNGTYEQDKVYGGGEPNGRVQAQRQKRSPQAIPDGPFPSFAGGARPEPSFELDDEMLNMSISDRGPPSRQQREPPPPRGGVQRSASENMRNNRPLGDSYMNSGTGGARFSPGRGGRPPPPGRGRGPPLNMGMPLPNNAPPGRGYRPPGGPPPPMRQNTDPVWGNYNDGYSEQYAAPYHVEGPEPEYSMPQRSMTMPTTVSAPQQYTAYNPARHGTPQPQARSPPPLQQPQQDSGYYAAPPRRVAEPQWPRESVGAVLDAYYNEPEYTDGYGDHQFAEAYTVTNSNGGTPTRRNFSRPVNSPGLPPTTKEYESYAPPRQPDQGFAQQAHRSRSQPNLRGQENGNTYGGYDGATDVPPMPRNAPTNGFAGPGAVPHSLRMGTPASSSRSPISQAGMPPARTQLPQSQSQDALPEHPTPQDIKEVERVDVLPAHPPPIRPGLMQDSSSGYSQTPTSSYSQTPAPGYSQPPAPVRQYSPERSNSNAGSTVEAAPITAAELQQLMSSAKANPGDQKLQLTLARKLVEAATVLASDGGRADVKATRKNRESYINDAFKIVKKLTNSSHPYPEAMFYLASCYGEGQLGLQIDHERAFNLYQSGAKLNHAPSAYRTAVCCELGAGTRKDPLKSITWYKKAAALGETPAMFKLGMILLKGLLGQARNPRDAINWLKRAANQADEHNQHALHELALIYERPDQADNIIADQDYARELFIKAAELNYPASQFRMGCAYEYGLMSCPTDPRKSIAWYSKAAMKGDLDSQLALSGWYLTGSEGVIQQSDTEAYLWARKAAEKGLAKAEYALGYFTEVGIGVPPNLDEAKRWYYKAASQQHPKAQLRLQELKKGGVALQKSRERLSRSNAKNDGDCVVM